jgi:hypothetical protein
MKTLLKKTLPLFLTIYFISCSLFHAKAELTISSVDIKNNSTIKNKHVFNGFGCQGKNIFPELTFSNIDADAKSLAITVYDPDAPTTSGWWHYLAINISPKINKFSPIFASENKFLTSQGFNQIKNDYGFYNYGGPCPPAQDKAHRYIFSVYALKTEKIDILENSSAALAGFFINQNKISSASFTAFYQR